MIENGSADQRSVRHVCLGVTPLALLRINLMLNVCKTLLSDGEVNPPHIRFDDSTQDSRPA